MTDLFEPDLFSVFEPAFAPVGVGRFATIAEVCAKFELGDIEAIDQAGGNEINSRNFRVRATRGTYLLKRLPASADATLAGRSLALVQWLRAEGVPAPGVYVMPQGDVVLEHEGTHWCLMTFVPGRYFLGGDRDLEATAQAIGDLHAALDRVPRDLAPPRRWQYDFREAPDLLARVRQVQETWTERFGPASAARLDVAWPQIELLAARLAQTLPSWLERADTSHGDLHPHNLLLQNGTVAAFLDFDGFATLARPVALGFATYKLTRQWGAARRCADRRPDAMADAGCRFVKAVTRAQTAAPTFAECHEGARIEVFRRLLLVLFLDVIRGDRAWNHVLDVHLRGLQEIDVIFGEGTAFA